MWLLWERCGFMRDVLAGLWPCGRKGRMTDGVERCVELGIIDVSNLHLCSNNSHLGICFFSIISTKYLYFYLCNLQPMVRVAVQEINVYIYSKTLVMCTIFRQKVLGNFTNLSTRAETYWYTSAHDICGNVEIFLLAAVLPIHIKQAQSFSNSI